MEKVKVSSWKEALKVFADGGIPDTSNLFMPELKAKDLISVQPMTGPIGHVFNLKYKLKED